MPFKNWVAGDRVYAADVMTFLMNQAVIVCTNAAARPSSPVKGMTVYQSDVDQLQAWNGSSWVRLPSAGTIANADISGAAAIAYSKLNLAGSITSADIVDGTITSADIADGTIVNADINASAGITYGKLAAIPKVRLRRAANQAVTAGQTTITWDTEDADTDGFIAVSSNTITIPAGLGGMYSISGRIVSSTAFPANSYIVVTAAGVGYAYHIPSAGTQNNGAYSVTCLLNASATVEVACFLSSGSSNFTGNLEMCRLGA